MKVNREYEASDIDLGNKVHSFLFGMMRQKKADALAREVEELRALVGVA